MSWINWNEIERNFPDCENILLEIFIFSFKYGFSSFPVLIVFAGLRKSVVLSYILKYKTTID